MITWDQMDINDIGWYMGKSGDYQIEALDHGDESEIIINGVSFHEEPVDGRELKALAERVLERYISYTQARKYGGIVVLKEGGLEIDGQMVPFAIPLSGNQREILKKLIQLEG